MAEIVSFYVNEIVGGTDERQGHFSYRNILGYLLQFLHHIPFRNSFNRLRILHGKFLYLKTS